DQRDSAIAPCPIPACELACAQPAWDSEPDSWNRSSRSPDREKLNQKLPLPLVCVKRSTPVCARPALWLPLFRELPYSSRQGLVPPFRSLSPDDAWGCGTHHGGITMRKIDLKK